MILMPEIAYAVENIAEAILARKAAGSNFSIVAVAEGAMSAPDRARHSELGAAVDAVDDDDDDTAQRAALAEFHVTQSRSTEDLAARLEELTGLEARVTILGHVQRGGTPSTVDRLLATQLGTAAADAVAAGKTGVMIAMRDGRSEAIDLEEVAGRRKTVPLDHPWIESARRLGVCLGD